MLRTADLFLLDVACQPIADALDGPSGVYLVGSAEQGKESPRDVDVRWIIWDDEFDRLFKGDGPGWYVDLWQVMSLAIGEYLRSRTGLPIDFQIQKASVANEKHADLPRNALGHRSRRFAGGGDGTDWSEHAR